MNSLQTQGKAWKPQKSRKKWSPFSVEASPCSGPSHSSCLMIWFLRFRVSPDAKLTPPCHILGLSNGWTEIFTRNTAFLCYWMLPLLDSVFFPQLNLKHCSWSAKASSSQGCLHLPWMCILMLLHGEENWGHFPPCPKWFPKSFKIIVLYA